ncbi:MAG: nucleotide exchange factor GrpE [Phycisphaeraceae bacterium]|nr:nucleotide exchange factor GrpE [Phycisphaeraceae bacterium]
MNPNGKPIPITNGDSESVHAEAPDLMSPTQDPPSSVSDAASADPAILQQELAAQKLNYLQLTTDFDNFIKRTHRDSGQQAALEKEAFIRDLLPIIDNLELALASESSNASEPLYQGVRMTLQQLGQLVGRHGIEPVEDRGRPFDPHRHEAISVRHDPYQPDQIILAVTQRGYWRGDKPFRPAKVIVNDLSRYPGERNAR